MNKQIIIGLSCVILIIFIGLIDALLFYQIVLSIFYLLPVMVGTYYINKQYGLFLAFFSVSIWCYTDTIDNKDNISIIVYFWNFGVRLLVFITLIILLNRLKKALENEKYYARMDNLTGIFNSRYFLELLSQEIHRSLRYNLIISLAYIDLDNFKFVNDKFGHKKGDEVLQKVVQTIKKEIRETDIIGRLGGDEFAIFLPETNSEGAQKLCQRLQNQVKKAMEIDSLPVSLSIGVVTFIQTPNSIESIIEKADQLMYEVKNSGKNNLKHLTINE